MKRAIVIPVGHEPEIHRFMAELVVVTTCFEDGSDPAIYVVVDSATDEKTCSVLDMVQILTPRVSIVQGPGGLAQAYLAGYRQAFNDGCDVLLEMDVGHDPIDAAHVLAFFNADDPPDFVAGVRWGREMATYNDRGRRWLLSRGGSWLVERATGDRRLTDWTSGFHAMDRRVLSEVLRAVTRDMPPGRWWQTAVRVAAMRAVTNLKLVSIAYTPTGKVPVRDVISSLARVTKLWWGSDD